MNDNADNRIRLAKMLGLECWTDFNGRERVFKAKSRTSAIDFDPYTDANDCDAMIRHLNRLGIFVEITHFADGTCWVQIEGPNHHPRERYEGDDYKQGVCELALKVLNND